MGLLLSKQPKVRKLQLTFKGTFYQETHTESASLGRAGSSGEWMVGALAQRPQTCALDGPQPQRKLGPEPNDK